MTRGARAAAALCCGLVLGVAASAAATPGPDGAAASRAAAWLARQPAAGTPGGAQADTIVALRAAGRTPAALRSRVTALTRVAPGYATTPGAAGKVVLAAVAARADPRRLGGVDYLRRITAGYAAGRYGATAYDQALSILALRAAGRPVPAAAVRATIAARGPGGWSYDLDPGSRDAVDTTGLVIEALRAAGVPARNPALRAGATWMLAQRNAEGGVATAGRGAATDANSTANAIRALRALGRTPPARMRAALRALQERDGGVRYTRASEGSRLLATNDAAIAFAGKVLPLR
ncbi:MAG: hypothetical protein AB7R33_07475 [Thermoleophilia bacterium]